MSVCLSYLWLFWRRKSVLLGEKIIVCTDNHFRFQCCQILVKLATFGPSVATKFLYLMMFISTVRQEIYIENHSEKFTSTKAHLRLKCLQENSYFLTTHIFILCIESQHEFALITFFLGHPSKQTSICLTKDDLFRPSFHFSQNSCSLGSIHIISVLYNFYKFWQIYTILQCERLHKSFRAALVRVHAAPCFIKEIERHDQSATTIGLGSFYFEISKLGR